MAPLALPRAAGSTSSRSISGQRWCSLAGGRCCRNSCGSDGGSTSPRSRLFFPPGSARALRLRPAPPSWLSWRRCRMSHSRYGPLHRAITSSSMARCRRPRSTARWRERRSMSPSVWRRSPSCSAREPSTVRNAITASSRPSRSRPWSSWRRWWGSACSRSTGSRTGSAMSSPRRRQN